MFGRRLLRLGDARAGDHAGPRHGGGPKQYVAARMTVAHVSLPLGFAESSRRMQRKPTWLMPESTIWAWRAAGR